MRLEGLVLQKNGIKKYKIGKLHNVKVAWLEPISFRIFYVWIDQFLTKHFLITDLDDEFSAEPSDLEADEGFLTILPCRPPDGYPKPMVTWKRSEEYVNLDQRIHINDQGDLVIQKLFKEDEGRYQCIVSNMAGTRDSTVARLHVRRKIFI